MSRPKVFPEVRGSHLAGTIERKKALRRLEEIKNKKAAKMANGSKVTPIKSAPAGGGDPEPPRRRRGRVLGSADRDVIVGAVRRYSKERVISLLRVICPDNPSPQSTIGDLLSEPEHPWYRRNYQALTDLAEYIQINCQEQLRFPKHVIPGNHLAQVPTAPERTLAPQPSNVDAVSMVRMMTDAFAQAMATVVSSLQSSAPAHPALPPRSEPPGRTDFAPESDPADYGLPASEPMPFKDRPTWIKRKCLHDMHTRIAARIKEQGFEISRPHAEAWTRSYDAFITESGVDVRAKASERSDRTGKMVRPIEVIEEMGELDRFYEIVKKLWEGWF